ncbi:MAG: C-terminal binding protein [Megasphaera sp.]|jgi:phosphoglycerate dehydrogenase-like enzyme|uniref:C-terminal binding protein n=1 Tax=Megasphaera sueciensis TaxID=349094 RepID=UPI002ACB1727|nr:C-terminal binding protein [Megasphaera sp.]MCI1822991.1 C-terminal binding protein [Megasphaera sp.]
MYHISVLGHNDDDDFGESLGDIAHVAYCPALNEDKLAEQCREAQVLICRDEPVTKNLLEKLDQLKLIVILSARYDNVDLAAAAARHVTVIHNPSYCIEDIADHTCAMILALIRQLPEYQEDIRNNTRWQYGTVAWPIHRVADTVIGLVGFGHIGRVVAEHMQCFGCRIDAYDPFVSEKIMIKNRVKPVDLDALLAECDVVSLHMPLNDTTQYIFQEEQFEQMKQGSMFINCCRGGLVDEAALYHAVDEGHIRSAALDVLSMEHPSPVMLKMIDRPEFLLTPQCGCHSVEAERALKSDAVGFIRAFFEGRLKELPIVAAREK